MVTGGSSKDGDRDGWEELVVFFEKYSIYQCFIVHHALLFGGHLIDFDCLGLFLMKPESSTCVVPQFQQFRRFFLKLKKM